MARDLGLANRIRAKGVRVVEVAGWQTRGSSTFAPRGSVNHHTAGPKSGATPSLNICINGRAGLSGPLCNVYQSRDPSGNDIAYIVASGRANHAGKGGWRGLTGNSSMHGLEIEHPGLTDVPVHRLEIAARIQAAFLEFSSRDANLCCQHFEWTTRKIDFNRLAPFTPNSFRDRVRFWIGRTSGSAPAPVPAPKPTPVPLPPIDEEEDEMIVLLAPGKPPRVIFGGRQFGFRDQTQWANFRWGVAAAGKKLVEWKVSVNQYDYMIKQYPGS